MAQSWREFSHWVTDAGCPLFFGGLSRQAAAEAGVLSTFLGVGGGLLDEPAFRCAFSEAFAGAFPACCSALCLASTRACACVGPEPEVPAPLTCRLWSSRASFRLLPAPHMAAVLFGRRLARRNNHEHGILKPSHATGDPVEGSAEPARLSLSLLTTVLQHKSSGSKNNLSGPTSAQHPVYVC